MIHGFNTNVEHAGRVFHVQTEHLTQVHPVLQSIVFCDGEVIGVVEHAYAASAIAERGESILKRRMTDQHGRLVAGIRAGLIELEIVIDPPPRFDPPPKPQPKPRPEPQPQPRPQSKPQPKPQPQPRPQPQPGPEPGPTRRDPPPRPHVAGGRLALLAGCAALVAIVLALLAPHPRAPRPVAQESEHTVVAVAPAPAAAPPAVATPTPAPAPFVEPTAAVPEAELPQSVDVPPPVERPAAAPVPVPEPTPPSAEEPPAAVPPVERPATAPVPVPEPPPAVAPEPTPPPAQAPTAAVPPVEPPPAAAPLELPPRPLQRALPRYTARARRKKEGGTVTLDLHLDATGAVTGVVVVSGLGGSELEQAAVEAARLWRYAPATRDGQPVATRHTVDLEFSAEGGTARVRIQE